MGEVELKPGWILKTDSLDEEPQEREFDSKETAIDFAVVWFVSSYDPETNETMRGQVPSGIAEDTIQLIDDLRSGREFRCSNFYETASITKAPPPADASGSPC
jgi:hypothetical protein